MKKNFKYIRLHWVLFVFCIIGSQTITGQDFMNFDYVDINSLSEESQRHYNHYASNPNLKNIELFRVNTEMLNEPIITFRLENGNGHEFSMDNNEEREIGIDSYFGTLKDDSGIFFTVKGQQMISKFYDGEDPITILPLEEDVHMLLRFGEGVYQTECGAPDSEDDHFMVESATTRNDNGCNVRVQISITDDADAVIPGDLHLFAYSAIDESNLAFQRSNTVIRFEIAYVRRFVATENLGRNAANRVIELQQYFDGDAPYQNVGVYRNNYRADLNILIVSQNMDGGGLFGQVIAVGVSEANAYSICSVPGITDGRFTFTHELGHIMGARHENHGTNYNRGMVVQPATVANRRRTIMARTGAAACALATSCRIQNFSNPDVDWGGLATGNAGNFDNARWLDEQANNIRNYRENWDNVTVNPETIPANAMGNYSADNSISTNGDVICQNNGELNLRAGTRVDLNNGFRIDNGGVGAIILGNCNASYPREDTDDADQVKSQEVENEVSDYYSIKVNPNPISTFARIDYVLKESGPISIVLSDINGKQIQMILQNQEMEKGSHSLDFVNHSFQSGVYYLTLYTKDYTETKKLMVIK